MIAELLTPGNVVFGLSGGFHGALETLCRRSSIPNLSAQLRINDNDRREQRYAFIGDGIAVPHLRVDNLPAPQLFLGLSREGVRLNDQAAHIVLFLVTPAEQPAQHLQLLQRVCSLLPAIRDELLAQRDPVQVLKIIARAERESALPTYINLSQEQIGFELQTDLTNGLTSEEAAARLRHYGHNLLKQARRSPWYLKLIQNLFSFFAVLLWIAAFLCFVPGVDLPQLVSLF